MVPALVWDSVRRPTVVDDASYGRLALEAPSAFERLIEPLLDPLGSSLTLTDGSGPLWLRITRHKRCPGSDIASRARQGSRMARQNIKVNATLGPSLSSGRMRMLQGEIWPAAWATAVHLERLMQSCARLQDTLTIVELGSGVGLCGLVAAAHSPVNTFLFLTDESPELCEVNASALSQLRPDIKAEAFILEWGQPLHPTLSATSSGSRRMLVIGSEVTPMPSTHDQLLDTVAALLPAPGVATGLGVFTVDACRVGEAGVYPRDCPNNALGRALCAGHTFLYNVERRGLRWRAAEVWHADDIRRVCEDRRVGVSVDRVREFACTSEYVVMVHVWRAGRGWDPDSN